MPPLFSAPLLRLLATLALAFLSLPATLAAGTRTNVTVDDTDGSATGGFQIVYEPPGVWSTGQNCTTCEAKVDKTKATDGTWHDVSFISDNPPPSPITATLTFNGVGVYAFCIITQSFTDPNGNWDLTFLIDGEQSGTFELAPDGDDTYRYNVPVYGNDSLTPGTHTFTMVVGHAGGQSSLALLDYMVFTQEDGADAPVTSSAASTPSSPSSVSSTFTASSSATAPAIDPSAHSSATTTIALSVTLTAVALLGLGGAIFFCTRRRYQRKYAQRAETSTLDGGKAEGDGETPSTAGFRVLPVFPRTRASDIDPQQVAHPFFVPPPPLSPPSRSPSNATSYTWLPEAGAYVAVKPTAPAASVHSLASASQSRMDADLPPVPQSPQSPAGASSHEPTTLAGSGSGSGAQPAGRARGGSVLRYVQNDEGPEALSPLSEHSKAPLPSSPVSPSAGGSQHGSGPMTVLGTDMDVEEGPPPYAPRAPSRVGQQ
ncbi:hypothetical protein VTO73DRAFT_9022 [Trametes versicolor]